MTTATALAVVPAAENPHEAMRYSLVQPLVDPAAAREAIRQYEALKTAIVQPSDIQRIQGRDFLKKSFWRRVATCFGLSLELESESRGFDEAGKLYYSVIYRAIAPNGRAMTADGWPEHNVRATAHTRAKNRAISDLVGGGEVSAEEFGDEEREPTQTAQLVHHITLADCGEYAKDYGIPPDIFKRATRKYNGRWDDLLGAMTSYVATRDADAAARAANEAAEAQQAQDDMSELPVGARGN